MLLMTTLLCDYSITFAVSVHNGRLTYEEGCEDCAHDLPGEGEVHDQHGHHRQQQHPGEHDHPQPPQHPSEGGQGLTGGWELSVLQEVFVGFILADKAVLG